MRNGSGGTTDRDDEPQFGTGRRVPFGSDAFASALRTCADPGAAWGLMTETAFAFGYVSVDYGLARLTPEPPGFRVLTHLATNDWSERYAERGYAAHDRFTRAKLTRTTPYAYAEIWDAPPETAVQAEMEAEIRSRGIHSGLAIPLHGPGPLLAALDLGHSGSETERAVEDAADRPQLVLMAALFNERMHALLGVNDHTGEPLLPREREVLEWAARGKTSWETAVILSVSESTVKKHLAAAAGRLDARTRTQAVAAALSRGLIRP